MITATNDNTAAPLRLVSNRFSRATGESDPNPGRDGLSQRHWGMLNQESGILRDVILERPYRTITIAEQRELGFPVIPEQVGSESLLIQLHAVCEGAPQRYQVRPDKPRTLKDSNGKPRIVKYEGEPRKPPILDVHPRSREQLGNVKIPLWIGEGSRKGDSGVSRGLCVINLSGVWAWCHDKTALPDWRFVSLKNRLVFVCFDDDAIVKAAVARALHDLGGFLELRGATVRVIDWGTSSRG